MNILSFRGVHLKKETVDYKTDAETDGLVRGSRSWIESEFLDDGKKDTYGSENQ